VAAPSGHLQVNLLALNFWFSLFMSFVNCLLTFFIQLNKLDQALTPVVKVAVVAILLAALVGLGYFSVRHLSSFSGNV
jgi:ABC-type phosphate/phosphonate transport system permease subunit